MKLPETIKTDRLLLRKPVIKDAQPIFDGYAHDPDVIRYLTWLPHATITDTQQFLEAQIDAWDNQSAFVYTITLADSELVIGMFGVEIAGHSAEAGYVLAPTHWGKGYMSEALRSMRGIVLGLPGIHRFWLVCDVENPASARVMEKAGFTREGILQKMMIHPNISPVPRDCLCYAAVKE